MLKGSQEDKQKRKMKIQHLNNGFIKIDSAYGLIYRIEKLCGALGTFFNLSLDINEESLYDDLTEEDKKKILEAMNKAHKTIDEIVDPILDKYEKELREKSELNDNE